MNNLNYTYNNNDVEAAEDEKGPFNNLVNTFRARGCSNIASTAVSKSKWQCLSMFLDITRYSE
jgi:hypothetical protein